MNQKIARILTGIIIISFGVGALLDALNIVEFWKLVSNWWPIGLIAAGILVFLNDFKQYIWSIILVGIGIIVQLRILQLVDINVFSLILPIVIIGIGLSVLINRSMTRKNIRIQDLDNISAIFGGTETINKSSNYQGGKTSAIFGGVSIDLRDAVIKKEATIEVFALCGGIELKVPREWRIQSHVFPILGGVESKSHSEKSDDNAPVLIITGTVALGGVEVRS